MQTTAPTQKTAKRVPIIPQRQAPAKAAAAREMKVRVKFFKPEEPFATVHGDSIAEYQQNGIYFDHYGYVVHEQHAARPRSEVEQIHDAHRDAQDELRAEAKKKAEQASAKLGALLEGDGEETAPPVEMPEDGWDEASVTKKFADRPDDVKKLRALTNKAINGYCKKAGIEFNPNNGVAAKWENIEALLTATAPDPDADGDQASEGGGGNAE